MTVWAGWEITALWGTTTITGLQSFSFDAGQDVDAIYEAGDRTVQEIHERNMRPVTGSITRRFSAYNDEWIISATDTNALSYYDIVVQHGSTPKFTMQSAKLSGYSYRYDVDGYAEETIDFTAKSLLPEAS